MADSDVVATINDTTAVGSQGVIDILQAAGIPRFEVSPSTEDLDLAQLVRDRRGGSRHHVHDGAAAAQDEAQEDLHHRRRRPDDRDVLPRR